MAAAAICLVFGAGRAGESQAGARREVLAQAVESQETRRFGTVADGRPSATTTRAATRVDREARPGVFERATLRVLLTALAAAASAVLVAVPGVAGAATATVVQDPDHEFEDVVEYHAVGGERNVVSARARASGGGAWTIKDTGATIVAIAP